MIRTKLKNLYQRIIKGKDWNKRDGLVLSLVKDGNRFYTFSDAVAMPNIRHENVFARTEQVSLGVTPESQQAFVKTMKDAGVKGEIGNMMMLLNYYEQVINQPINLTPMLYLSNPVVVLNDEPIDEMKQSYQDEKMKLQQEDEQIRVFFLKRSLSILHNSQQDLTDTEIWTELMNPTARKIESQFLKLIGIPSF